MVNKGGAPTKIKLSFGSLEAVRGAKVSDWLDGVTSIVYLDEFDVLAMAPGTYFGSVELERTWVWSGDGKFLWEFDKEFCIEGFDNVREDWSVKVFCINV